MYVHLYIILHYPIYETLLPHGMGVLLSCHPIYEVFPHVVIVCSLSFHLPIMATLTPRKPKGALYTTEEHIVINVFREEYRSQINSEQRGPMFKSKILPAIFDYWAQDGPNSISSEVVEEHVKVN